MVTLTGVHEKINYTMADAKQGKSPIEDFCNGSSQSRSVLAKPRLGGFGASSFASSSSKTCNPFGSVLRPSQLKPGSNPFLKVTEPAEEKSNEEKKETEPEDRLKDSKEEVEPPKFVPLGSANVTPRTGNPVPAPAQPPPSSSAGFVFGQNLSERVVIQENVNNENVNNGEANVDHSTTNGTTDGKSELLFTSAAASVKDNVQEEAGGSEGGAGGAGGAGLAAAAAEYERCHARPPPPAPAPAYSLTGEEDELNVLQISCRLFAWEAGSWRERGRGVLRLNDAASGGGSRLVARVAGSLRVVLNTKLWPDMAVERAGTKSLRITAADAQQQIKLFLVMGAPADIVQLYRALTSRVAHSKRSGCAHNAPSQRAAERLEATADVDEFLDKHEDTQDPQDALDPSKPPQLPEEPQDPSKTPREEPNPLKRKEPTDDETTQKRQCPEESIE